MYKKVIICVLCIGYQLYPTQSFVAKKKKTISIATLKNNCCDACTDLLEMSAKLIEIIATQQLTAEKKDNTLLNIIKDMGIIQQCMLSNIRSIIEGTVDSFFAKATKMQLQECDEKTKKCYQELTTLQKKITITADMCIEMKTAHKQLCDYIAYMKTI